MKNFQNVTYYTPDIVMTFKSNFLLHILKLPFPTVFSIKQHNIGVFSFSFLAE